MPVLPRCVLFRSTCALAAANAATVVGIVAPLVAQQTAPAVFKPLVAPDGPAAMSEALAVSPDGLVVAGEAASSDEGVGKNAFLWTRGAATFPLPGMPRAALSSQPRAVNDGSMLVGNVEFGQCPSRAFRWASGQAAVVLDDLPGGDTLGGALDVSGDGKIIVGWGATADGLEAVRWRDGVPKALGDVPGGPVRSSAAVVARDGGIAAGTGTNEQGRIAVRWSAANELTVLGDLDGGEQDSEPFGMSADGAVIVGRGNSARGPEAFRWTAADGLQGLGDLAGGKFESIAFDVAADGKRVVGTADGDAGPEAFVWDAGAGMRSVRALLAAAGAKDLDGWRLTSVNAISDDGRVLVGAGVDPQGRSRAWLAELPRPAR